MENQDTRGQNPIDYILKETKISLLHGHELDYVRHVEYRGPTRQ
jgi:hypothetical protein